MEKKDYEAMFLYGSQENIFSETLAFTKTLLSQVGAEFVSEEDLGIKRLAYEIKKRKDGHYYFFKLKMDGTKLKEVRRELSLKEDVLRYIFVKVEKKYYPKRSESRERNYQQQFNHDERPYQQGEAQEDSWKSY